MKYGNIINIAAEGTPDEVTALVVAELDKI